MLHREYVVPSSDDGPPDTVCHLPGEEHRTSSGIGLTCDPPPVEDRAFYNEQIESLVQKQTEAIVAEIGPGRMHLFLAPWIQVRVYL